MQVHDIPLTLKILMRQFDLSNVVSLLNELLEARLLGVTRYTHYALMVSGTERITMANFFTAQASECLRQAQAISKLLMALNERPSLAPQPFCEPPQQSIHEMLLRSLHSEHQALGLYQDLQADRCAKINCLQVFAQEMVYQLIADTQRLQALLKTKEQPGRAMGKFAAIAVA
jgi:bacterioferritin